METIDFGIENKVAVVTGASRGLGRGLAKAMAYSGAIVAAAARRQPELETLVEEIRAKGGSCESFLLDLRDMESISSTFSRIVERFGRVDILVNNAGMGNPLPAELITEEDWDWMMDLNLKGTFFCCQAAGKIMLAQGKGRIVNISSQASVVAIPGEAVYCASKGGLNMLTKVLAADMVTGTLLLVDGGWTAL